jgi:hypothetical protein
MEAKLDKSGFVPGEVVSFQSKLMNDSNKEVNVSLSLIQVCQPLQSHRLYLSLRMLEC